ncbi:uncharacterized protein LOC141908709 [Tubulanus polymorphus]|uniref:uncharacterized protein LOC141908709 n=1 Tax=Tubulanus polymorphus TaxID=672921 RepID=UPI003DA542DD
MAAINPDNLKPWKKSAKVKTLDDSFSGMFSLNEKMMANLSSQGASMGEDAHYDARQSIYCLAKMVDLGLTTRALIQPRSQDRALTIDLVPRTSTNGVKAFLLPDSADPMILVRVAHHRKSKDSLRHAQLFMSSSPKNGVQSVTAASAEEMKILIEEFKQNHDLLDKKYLKNLESKLPPRLLMLENGFTSFFKPLLTPKPKKEIDPCSACRMKPGKHVCSRCKVARYCSKECQRTDWKDSHKKTCSSPEARAQKKLNTLGVATGDINANQLWVDIDPQRTPNEMRFVSTISNQGSFAHTMRKAMKDGIKNVQEDVLQRKKDKMMILKIQVPPFSSVADNKPIMIYPQGKKFQVMAVSENVIGGIAEYCKLFEMVRKFGSNGGIDVAGVKAYLSGYITADGLVRIMIDEVKPLQAW